MVIILTLSLAGPSIELLSYFFLWNTPLKVRSNYCDYYFWRLYGFKCWVGANYILYSSITGVTGHVVAWWLQLQTFSHHNLSGIVQHMPKTLSQFNCMTQSRRPCHQILALQFDEEFLDFHHKITITSASVICDVAVWAAHLRVVLD